MEYGDGEKRTYKLQGLFVDYSLRLSLDKYCQDLQEFQNNDILDIFEEILLDIFSDIPCKNLTKNLNWKAFQKY